MITLNSAEFGSVYDELGAHIALKPFSDLASVYNRYQLFYEDSPFYHNEASQIGFYMQCFNTSNPNSGSLFIQEYSTYSEEDNSSKGRADLLLAYRMMKDDFCRVLFEFKHFKTNESSSDLVSDTSAAEWTKDAVNDAFKQAKGYYQAEKPYYDKIPGGLNICAVCTECFRSTSEDFNYENERYLRWIKSIYNGLQFFGVNGFYLEYRYREQELEQLSDRVKELKPLDNCVALAIYGKIGPAE
jgi:PD-(D/E)XK nuclease superfamily